VENGNSCAAPKTRLESVRKFKSLRRKEAAIAPTKKSKPASKKTAPKKAAVKKAPIKKAEPKAEKAPVKKTAAKTAKPDNRIYDIIMAALDKEKGENIVSIDLTGKTAIADYMVIVSGTSSRQVTAMAEKLKDKLSKEGFKSRIEGKATGDWVILDAGDVIVHLFRPEVRSFYNLEKLWMSDFSTVGYNLYTT
jgi:ribosome-associated protein